MSFKSDYKIFVGWAGSNTYTLLGLDPILALAKTSLHVYNDSLSYAMSNTLIIM